MISFFSRLFKKAPSATPHSKTSTNNAQNRVNTPVTAEQPTLPSHYGPELLGLARDTKASKQRTAARQQIAKLLEDNTITLSQITADAQNTDELLNLCSYNAAAVDDILSTITDQQALAAIANEAPSAQVRKAAAERVTERSAVESMLKGAKGKDKNVYKVAKSRLAVFKAEDDALAQRHAHLASICNDAERHAKKPFDHLYTHKFVSLEQDWQAHEADATPELQARFDNAIANCQKIIDAEIDKGKAAALAEQLANSMVASIEAATQAVNQVAQALYDGQNLDTDALAQLKEQLSEQSQNVQAQINNGQSSSSKSNEQQKAQQKAQQTFYQASEATHALLKLVEQDGTISTLVATLNSQEKEAAESTRKAISAQLNIRHNLPTLQSEIADTAKAAIAQWQQQQNDIAAKRKALIGQVSDLIRRANIAANSGQVRRARGIAKELNEKRAELTDIPLGIANKLELLDETMTKLGDWHDFAVTPKKEALVEKMTALQSSELAPDDLADKIHALQDEWKVLCKGGQNQDEELWQAFQQSADVAFEPCKKHFAEQAEIREKNAEQRKALTQQLEQYHEAYNWEQAVWKDVEQTLRVAKDTWKTLWPVPRQQQKELQSSFDAALDKIYGEMNAAYEVVKQRKLQLIELAEKATQHSDPKRAAEDIKQLQQNWKQAGRTFRKTDQQLWTQFRALCDEVFNKRQTIFDEANAERDQLIAQANTLIDQLEAIAQEDGEKLQTQGSEISDLKTAFAELGDIPKAEYSKFHALLSKIEQKISSHRSDAQQQAWKSLFTINTQLTALELSTDNGDTLDALKEQLSTTKLPSNCNEAFLQRVNALGSNDNTALHSSEEALRLLCIRAEIANGIESPAEDKTQRMNYQVEALKQNFGSTQTDTAESLAREWITISHCPANSLQSLQQRFLENTFEKANNKVAEPA